MGLSYTCTHETVLHVCTRNAAHSLCKGSWQLEMPARVSGVSRDACFKRAGYIGTTTIQAVHSLRQKVAACSSAGGWHTCMHALLVQLRHRDVVRVQCGLTMHHVHTDVFANTHSHTHSYTTTHSHTHTHTHPASSVGCCCWYHAFLYRGSRVPVQKCAQSTCQHAQSNHSVGCFASSLRPAQHTITQPFTTFTADPPMPLPLKAQTPPTPTAMLEMFWLPAAALMIPQVHCCCMYHYTPLKRTRSTHSKAARRHTCAPRQQTVSLSTRLADTQQQE